VRALEQRIQISRGLRRSALAVGALGVALLFLGLAPVAQARFLRAPKWLKGPYRQYNLTYSATASSQGQSTNRPTAGCVATVNTSRGNATVHWEATYQFLFGRYRPPRGRYHTAFVFRIVHHAASGQILYTFDSAPPPGCPDNPDQRTHMSCTQRVLDQGAEPLDIADLRPSHGASRYGAQVTPNVDEDNCAEGGEGDAGRHFQIVHPGPGTIIFTDRGVFARRTFQGTFSYPPIPHSRQGTDTNSDGVPTDDWTFGWGATGTFKLAPVH
jgi:hypothetical protein